MKYDPGYTLYILGIKLFNIQKIYLTSTEYFLKINSNAHEFLFIESTKKLLSEIFSNRWTKQNLCSLPQMNNPSTMLTDN